MAGRFVRLSGAAGIEGALSTAFLLYLAWRDAQAYGELMYGLAAAVIVSKVVEFGLYYPLVTALGRVPRGDAGLLMAPVGLFRTVVSCGALSAAVGFVLWRDLVPQTAFALLVLVAGFGMEATAVTAFAEWRLRGQQHREARLRVSAALVAYAFGFASAALGASSPVIAAFKPLGALVLLFGARRALEGASALAAPRAAWGALRPLVGAGLVLGSVDILGTAYNKANFFFIEAAAAATGVALYSASWNIVDAVSLLVSEQFLAWVLFPSLALSWAAGPERALALARGQARFLFPVACAAMLVLHQESPLIIGLLYPDNFEPSAALQRILVFTIVLSVLHNLWAGLMIVAGAGRVLLAFAVLTTGFNLVLNALLVPRLGLVGGCHVIVLTKLFMCALTTAYCQRRFHLFRIADAASILLPPALVLAVFSAARPLLPLHLAVAGGVGLYGWLAWRAFDRSAPAEG